MSEPKPKLQEVQLLFADISCASALLEVEHHLISSAGFVLTSLYILVYMYIIHMYIYIYIYICIHIYTCIY